MSRRNRAVKRESSGHRYSNLTIQNFINRMMRGGKKSVAQHVMYDTLGLIERTRKAQSGGCVRSGHAQRHADN